MTDEIELGLSQLENNALDRKKRLLEMRQKAKKSKADTGCASETEKESAVLFRSYEPTADYSIIQKLKDKKHDALVTLETAVYDYIEDSRKIIVSKNLEATEVVGTRKPDWDLKRMIQPKLNKLEIRTEKAIAAHIRQKLGSGNIDLTSAVTHGAAATYADED